MVQINFKGKPIHTSGDLPTIHSKAPDFTLVDAELRDRSLKDFKGKRKLISIVPSLDTPVCSLSTKKFNDTAKNHPEIMILVVSADLPFAQKRVCDHESVKNVVTLSLMRSKDFAKTYGVLIEDGPLAGITARAVLVLDENDQVVYREFVSEISQEPNYENALKVLLSK
jgi:thioredoxin-dependent peroxiredoxin